MLIGLTYDLRSAYLAAGYGEVETAEFDRDDTIDAIENALVTLGHEVVRIGHVRELVSCLARGERWDLVFNICEGLHGSARESQVPALLDAYGIAYTFSDASLMALSLNKAWTKAVLADEIETPEYRVVQHLSDLETVDLAFPLFVKPLAEGTGKGVSAGSVVRNLDTLARQCEYLLATFRQPVLVETFLPGREFTVSILGTSDCSRVLGTFEIVLLDAAEPNAYGYVNKEECEDKVLYRLVSADEDPIVRDAESLALKAWRKLSCRDAGRIDIRCDSDGKPSFIEVNPLAGIHPWHSDLPMLATAVGMEYVELIRLIVESACERVDGSVLQSGVVARVA
ncbi:MAG: hypothetical protein WD002_12800 [Pseudomonadales bacterium]